MRKVLWALISAAMIYGFYMSRISTAHQVQTQQQQQQRYDAPTFSVEFPAGTRVKLQDDGDLEKEHAVTHFYTGYLPQHGLAKVEVTEFRGQVRDEDHTEIGYSHAAAKTLDQGIQASPITSATVGGQEGFQQTIHGQLLFKGQLFPSVIHWRMAISRDRIRIFCISTVALDDEEMSEADREKFFGSLQIK
jgi:hypothetical protein